MLTIKIYLKFSASASAVFHFPRFFFFQHSLNNAKVSRLVQGTVVLIITPLNKWKKVIF